MRIPVASLLPSWQSPKGMVRAAALATLAFSACIGALACSSPDLRGPVALDPAHTVWTVELSAHAITMDTLAPYDTLQLVVTARTVTGVPIPTTVLPTFTTSDSSVRVSPTGLLTARAVSNGVKVAVTLLDHGVRFTDTAVVNVTDDPAPRAFGHLLFGLFPGDSATLAAPNAGLSVLYYQNSKVLQAQAQDPQGAPIPLAIVALRTAAPNTVCPSTFGQCGTSAVTDDGATVQFDYLTNQPGQMVTVYASATVYGITRRDSIQLQFTRKLFELFQLTQQTGGTTPAFTLVPSAPVEIGVGGVVWWENLSSDSLDIVFDDSTAASPEPQYFGTTGGNIAPFPGSESFSFDAIRARRFLRAGTFHFHSIRTGVEGTIIVR